MWKRMLLLLLLLLLCPLGCAYDAPPEPALVFPEGGVFKSGDPIILRFSEPIDPNTLSIRIWPGPRDLEGEIPADAKPLLTGCTVAAETCDNATLEVFAKKNDEKTLVVIPLTELDPLGSEEVVEARLTLDPQGLGKSNLPLLIEIQAGLGDIHGNRTGTEYLFDVQFLPSEAVSGEAVPFTDGTYIFVATLQKPIDGLVITLINDVVTGSDGAVALAGADGDEVEGAPKNTSNPDELIVDGSERGFTIYAQGQLSQLGSNRYLEMQPTQLDISLGAIRLTLTDLVMSGTINTDPNTGYERLEGTLAYGGLIMEVGGKPVNYDAGSTSFLGTYVPPEKEPVGVPKVCGDLCGAVPVQCYPPPTFPPEGLCESSAESAGDETTREREPGASE
jgi:hypothetical protein